MALSETGSLRAIRSQGHEIATVYGSAYQERH